MVELKGVQDGYPFYGTLALQNGQAYSHGLVAHGGALWVSDNEPRGSVFNILLPETGRAATEEPEPALAASRERHV